MADTGIGQGGGGIGKEAADDHLLGAYTSRRPDLSVELVTDTLQKYGVIKDDRWIYEMHLYKEFGNPGGVEILIEECE